MKHLGLFEGIGGFSLAARWIGWETLAWCEWNKFCQKVLKHHFPEAEGFGDITKTDFTKYANRIDIITGGFPCQPYSSAGKRKGKEDDRHLWPEMLRAIREVKPTWVVGENVLGLVNWNGGLVFNEVQADLENEGYEILPYILPACAVGAPHRRERVWFVAYSDKCAKGPSRTSGRITGKGSNNNDEQKERGEQTEQHIGCSDVLQDATNTRLLGQEKCEKQTTRIEQCGKGGISEGNLWDRFPTQSPICGGDDGLPTELDGITFPKWRNESIKAYGNAIVPQVALQIFKAIEQYELTLSI
jgi:DNA (cytosine-5)-methyltransferase 1